MTYFSAIVPTLIINNPASASQSEPEKPNLKQIFSVHKDGSDYIKLVFDKKIDEPIPPTNTQTHLDNQRCIQLYLSISKNSPKSEYIINKPLVSKIKFADDGSGSLSINIFPSANVGILPNDIIDLHCFIEQKDNYIILKVSPMYVLLLAPVIKSGIGKNLENSSIEKSIDDFISTYEMNNKTKYGFLGAFQIALDEIGKSGYVEKQCPNCQVETLEDLMSISLKNMEKKEDIPHLVNTLIVFKKYKDELIKITNSKNLSAELIHLRIKLLNKIRNNLGMFEDHLTKEKSDNFLADVSKMMSDGDKTRLQALIDAKSKEDVKKVLEVNSDNNIRTESQKLSHDLPALTQILTNKKYNDMLKFVFDKGSFSKEDVKIEVYRGHVELIFKNVSNKLAKQVYNLGLPLVDKAIVSQSHNNTIINFSLIPPHGKKISASVLQAGDKYLVIKAIEGQDKIEAVPKTIDTDKTPEIKLAPKGDMKSLEANLKPGSIKWYPGKWYSGKRIIEAGVLNRNTKIGDIPCKAGEWVKFYKDGNLRGATLYQDTIINASKIGGILCKAGGEEEEVGFYENGDLNYATLSQDTEIAGIPCKAGTRVVFSDVGNLRYATLSQDTIIKNIKFDAGTEIEFDRDGNILPESLSKGRPVESKPISAPEAQNDRPLNSAQDQINFLKQNLGDKVRIDLIENNMIQIYAYKELTDEDLKYFKNINNLKIFNSNGNQKITGSGLKYLKDLPNLQEISVHDTKIENKYLAYLKEFKNLKSLLLIGDNFTDDSLVYIKELKNLQSLYLSGKNITDSGLKILKELKNLKELSIDKANITDEGLKNLEGLKDLEELRLSYLYEVEGSGLKYISELKNIKKLDISMMHKINDDDLKYLEGLKNLEELRFFGVAIRGPGLKYLKQLNKLKKLNLCGQDIADDYLIHISGLKNLEFLGFHWNTSLKGPGLIYLKYLKNLRRLDLGCTKINDDALENLKELKNLEYLDIAYTDITKNGYEMLKKAMPGTKF